MAITLTVSPPSPTSLDSVIITAAGPFGCSGNEKLVMTRSGYMFNGYVDYGGTLCFTTPPPLSASYTAGRLAPGAYTVIVADPRSTTTNTSFVVTGDLESVPTVDPVALAMIAAAILIIALPRLLRR